jgi:hypothetical protein
MSIRWQMCAVCHNPLMKVATATAVEWRHTISDAAGHDPIPVDADATSFTQRCDFCYGSPVMDMVLADDFLLPGTYSDKSSGAWCACGPCGVLVRQFQWSALVTRVREVSPSAVLVPRRVTSELYARLSAHMNGVQTVDEWLADRYANDDWPA